MRADLWHAPEVEPEHDRGVANTTNTFLATTPSLDISSAQYNGEQSIVYPTRSILQRKGGRTSVVCLPSYIT